MCGGRIYSLHVDAAVVLAVINIIEAQQEKICNYRKKKDAWYLYRNN
jgi:hypothetical protein